MGNKIIGLIIGLAAGVVIIVGIVLIASRVKAPEAQVPKALTVETIKQSKDKVSGLENYGNLPLIVSGDEIGRSNPFESY